MFLEKISINQVRGIEHAEYELSDLVEISGRNGCGKTTIALCHYWLWTDKDYSLNANPEMHSLYLEESEPSVEEVIRFVDGSKITVKKIQKDARTKKEVDAGKPIKISNKYEINGVPKAQKDFVKELESRGIDMDKFLMFSHPDVSINQKSADFRNFLFGMTEDVTDKQIADTMPECEDLAKLLESYKAEEIDAMYKRQKKQSKEQLDAIPQRIIGMEQAKQEVSVTSLTAKKKELLPALAMAQEAVDEIVIPDSNAIKEEMQRIKSQSLESRQNKAKADELIVKEAWNASEELRVKNNQLLYKCESASERIRSMSLNVAAESKQNEEDLQKYTKLKNDRKSLICPECGQPLPEEKVKDILDGMKARGNALAKQIASEKRTIEAEKAALTSLQSELDEVKQAYARAKDHYLKVSEASKHDEHMAEDPFVKARCDELAEQLNSIHALAETKRNAKQRVEAIRAELAECDRQLAKVDFNKKINEQICDLQLQQKQYAQSMADAEKILYQLSILSMKKNEVLEESVNKHFPDFVRFQLFRYQKNGDVVDDCTPMIKDETGWKNYKDSANTGLQILGKLGILSGIQDYYDAHYPIFLDGAESIDSETRKRIQNKSQVVLLTVKDDQDLTVTSI